MTINQGVSKKKNGFQKGHPYGRRFTKGFIPWNKGTNFTNPGSFQKGHIPWVTGRVRSEETKRKIGKANRGKTFSEEHKKKLSEAHKGLNIGNKHHRWLEDRSLLQRYNDVVKDRRSAAYGDWRKQVKVRDNYKCKIANQDCNGRLEAHHILGWTAYPELRYEINNGITLCHAHHPRKRGEEKRLIPTFQELVPVSKVIF